MLAVGTPGRLAELSREGVLQTHRTPVLVLDEVDQLLAPNFRADLSRILEHTGKDETNLAFVPWQSLWRGCPSLTWAATWSSDQQLSSVWPRVLAGCDMSCGALELTSSCQL